MNEPAVTPTQLPVAAGISPAKVSRIANEKL